MAEFPGSLAVSDSRRSTVNSDRTLLPNPRYQYPPIPELQHPPAARISQGRRPSDLAKLNTTKLHSSISSSGSASTGFSTLKPRDSHSPAWPPSPNSQKPRWSDHGIPTPEPWSPASHASTRPIVSRQEMVENNAAVLQYIEEQRRLEQQETAEPDHALWLLFWLSCLDPVHAFISALYTILVVFTLLLVSPIRLCQTQAPLDNQIIRIIAPIFRHHLEMMYAQSAENAYTFTFSATRLVLTHLAAPLVSFGVMIAAWVTAFFWILDKIMGNPDGTENSDDGRNAVLTVRDWYEQFLLRALRR